MIDEKKLLARINPGKDHFKHKFSRNLYLWMRKHKCQKVYFVARNRFQSDKSVGFSEDKNLPRQIYLGYADEHFMSGSPLIRIVCQGSKEPTMAYSVMTVTGKITEITDWFWEKYLRIGKCAIDPEHNEYWPKDRFKIITPNVRKCMWCGTVQNMTIKERIVRDEIWKDQK